jgi:hypothetical protein
MSELAPGSHHERHKPSPELEQHAQEALEKALEKGHHARHEHAEKLLTIQHEAKEKAISAQEYLKKQGEHETPMHEQPMFINRQIKSEAYKRTLTRTQKSLSPPARAFSKLVHNPAIDTISEVGAKTVARPSGILAGGIFACLGSGLFLWISKHYGYEYNFLLFALFFIGGFGVGLIIELLVRLFRRKR